MDTPAARPDTRCARGGKLLCGVSIRYKTVFAIFRFERSPVPGSAQTTIPATPPRCVSASLRLFPAVPASRGGPMQAVPCLASLFHCKFVSHAAFRAYLPESVLRARSPVTTTSTLTARPRVGSHFPQSRVTVGPNGKVKANIEAREIVVEGIVTGDLKASATCKESRAGQPHHPAHRN